MTDWKSRDLSLPEWGPYNKKYVGFSHIAHRERGLRFDVDLFPGFYRRSIMNTKAITDSGAKLWDARPDLLRFVIRYELAPDIFCHADFLQEGGQLTAHLDFVNETPLPQSLQLDLCCSIRVPTYENTPVHATAAPDCWLDGLDYASIDGLRRIPRDGLRKGEAFSFGAVNGTALDARFLNSSAQVRYTLPSTCDPVLRYRCETGSVIRVNGRDVPLSGGTGWLLHPLHFASPVSELVIEPMGADLILDGIALSPVCANDFRPYPHVYVPVITCGTDQLRLEYPDIDHPYTIRWDAQDHVIRELLGSSDDAILNDYIHNHTRSQLQGEGEGHFTDLFFRPLFLDPGQTKSLTIHFIAGDTPAKSILPLPLPDHQTNPSGLPYRLSRQLLAAAVQMNVVWPTYFRGQWIRHNTPGKVWDSFYTWDSGMIALGLLYLDEQRAIQCLNTYLSPMDDPHAPFLKHGTPLLTQIFAFQELLNRGQLRICHTLYPRLRRAWAYLREQTDLHQTGLLSTWHLFYNSGGWDDYPPQMAVHQQSLESSCTPAIATSFSILIAKILAGAARALGHQEDLPLYRKAEQDLSAAMQYSWDSRTGYFGYALHHTDGSFSGLLRTEKGIQINMGLDGLYPLLAGAGTAAQQEAMLRNLEEGLMTPFGISVVDLRSPDFRDSGYWNGSVWMPHQWIVWKSMLDHNRPDLANRIAITAMNLWKTETDRTHNSYEHFMLRNGRGAGFHHFSGLSSPILSWMAAYHQPGHLHSGFLTTIRSLQWDPDFTGVTFAYTADAPAAMILTLKAGENYQFLSCDTPISAEPLWDGTYVLSLPAGTARITVTIQ